MTGISGLAVCLPGGRAHFQGEHSAEAWTKPILGAEECIWDLAVRAAQDALREAGVLPDEVKIVIVGSAGVWNRDTWSPAAHIQKRIGACRAFSFDVLNGCNAANLALHVAHQWLKSHRSDDCALVIVADALSQLVDDRNPAHRCIAGFSDAASAVVLRRRETKSTILSFSACTNPDFADSMYRDRSMKTVWMNEDEEEDRVLGEEYRVRYCAMIREALINANATIEQVDHLFMNQGDHRLITYLEHALPVRPGVIFRSCHTHGHMGGSDLFFGLHERRRRNELRERQLVVLASSAIGFSWSASVLRM